MARRPNPASLMVSSCSYDQIDTLGVEFVIFWPRYSPEDEIVYFLVQPAVTNCRWCCVQLFVLALSVVASSAQHFSCFCLLFSIIVWEQEAQLGTGKTRKVTIGQAVSEGLVDNETLGYFMARTQMFLEMVGIFSWCVLCFCVMQRQLLSKGCRALLVCFPMIIRVRYVCEHFVSIYFFEHILWPVVSGHFLIFLPRWLEFGNFWTFTSNFPWNCDTKFGWLFRRQ